MVEFAHLEATNIYFLCIFWNLSRIKQIHVFFLFSLFRNNCILYILLCNLTIYIILLFSLDNRSWRSFITLHKVFSFSLLLLLFQLYGHNIISLRHFFFMSIYIFSSFLQLKNQNNLFLCHFIPMWAYVLDNSYCKFIRSKFFLFVIDKLTSRKDSKSLSFLTHIFF